MRVNLGRNLTLKTISLLLAIVCWYVVGHEEMRLVDFTVPVDYVNLPAEFALAGEVVDHVGVRLRGTEANMKTVSGSDIIARVDLSQALRGVTADIEAEHPSIRIGALTTLRELSEDPTVRRYLPSLGAAASRVATPQIRNVGTLGGNLPQGNP